MEPSTSPKVNIFTNLRNSCETKPNNFMTLKKVFKNDSSNEETIL